MEISNQVLKRIVSVIVILYLAQLSVASYTLIKDMEEYTKLIDAKNERIKLIESKVLELEAAVNYYESNNK